MKLFDLSKARVRVVMKERSILPALIKVLDRGWEFTVSVAVAGEEDVRRGREMGESTQQKLEPHSWTGGRKRAEEAKSTAVGRASDGAVGRMKEGKVCQKVDFAPVGTRGKRRPTVGNNLSQPSQSFSLNSNILRTGYVGPRQDGDVCDGRDKAQSNVEDGLQASKQGKRAQSSLQPSPQVETDLGQKRGVSLIGPLSLFGQEMGGKQPISAKGSLRRDDPSAKGRGR